MSSICPICGADAKVTLDGPLNTETTIVCPCCGAFTITEVAEENMNRDKVASWLYYHAKYDNSQKRFTSYYYISERDMGKADAHYITLMEIENWYPKTFSDKVDNYLLMLYSRTERLGDKKRFTANEAVSACFGKRIIDSLNQRMKVESINQCGEFVSYLIRKGYLRSDSLYDSVSLSPDGLQRVDELQKNNPNNRDVFIAMSFDPKNDDTKEAIKTGIIDAGYTPVIMSEIIHNKQIVPMMFRLIRESKLLVMDVTDPNFGAYHEAGYALGLGKDVIITCREEEFNNPDNKPHFDIAQKQILVWKDYEDLTVRLSEWIKAITG